MLKYGCQTISDGDIESVISVLRSEMLTQGPVVNSFENYFAEYVGADDAIAVNSATSGLHLAYLALGLVPGDLLWTSPNTFAATANAAIMCGANVDFVDIDENDGNLSIAALEYKLNSASKLGKLPKIVVPVHFSGIPCKMKQISELSKKFGFKIVEDASHATGAKYTIDEVSSLVGNCKYSDVTVFSFHPVKIITTGEGGMITTNNNEIAQQVRLLRSHGVTRDEAIMGEKKQGGWHYDQIALGYNYRLTDIQAALGISQLTQLDGFLKIRRELAKLYNSRLISVNEIQIPDIESCENSAWHLYVVRVPKQMRKQIFDYLIKAKIGVNVHYKPVHTNSFYKNIGFKLGDFPKAENLYDRMITLPIHPNLTKNDINFICDTLFDAFNE